MRCVCLRMLRIRSAGVFVFVSGAFDPSGTEKCVRLRHGMTLYCDNGRLLKAMDEIKKRDKEKRRSPSRRKEIRASGAITEHQTDRDRTARAPLLRRHLAPATTSRCKCLPLSFISCGNPTCTSRSVAPFSVQQVASRALRTDWRRRKFFSLLSLRVPGACF